MLFLYYLLLTSPDYILFINSRLNGAGDDALTSSSRLNGTGNRTETVVVQPAVKKLSSRKAAQLREFLMLRERVPVVKSAPANLKTQTIQTEKAVRKLKNMVRLC